MEKIKNKKQKFIEWLNFMVKDSDINDEWGAFNASTEKFNEIFKDYLDVDEVQKINYNLAKKRVDNLNAENVLNSMLKNVGDLILNQMKFNRVTTELTYDEYYKGMVGGLGGIFQQVMLYCSMKNLEIERLLDNLNKANIEMWNEDLLQDPGEKKEKEMIDNLNREIDKGIRKEIDKDLLESDGLDWEIAAEHFKRVGITVKEFYGDIKKAYVGFQLGGKIKSMDKYYQSEIGNLVKVNLDLIKEKRDLVDKCEGNKKHLWNEIRRLEGELKMFIPMPGCGIYFKKEK